MKPGFIFGGDTKWSYDELQRKRRMADALASSMGTPRNVGEGLASIGKALAIRGINKRAGKEESRMRGELDAKWASLFGGGSGGAGSAPRATAGAYTPPNPIDDKYPVGQTGPVQQGNVDEATGLNMGAPVEMDLKGGIEASAQALGISPHDLATAISYETGGTFDPLQKGPTTQWGQHRGLIQFGEPQAQEYGVDWDNPLNSQLGAEGAVVKYLRKAGVEPGMGLMDIYSAINAGGVGRYNASDANNGGAPGSVADKVNNQMGGHARKAAALLGGTYQPGASSGGDPSGGRPGAGMNMHVLAEIAGSPMASPGRKALANALLQQQLQANDPNRQLELQIKRAQLEQIQNPAQEKRDTQYIDGVGLIDKQTGEVISAAPEKKPRQPSSVQEYQFYQSQEVDNGRQPLSFADWSVMDEKAGNPAMTQLQSDARSTASDVVVNTVSRALGAARDRSVGGLAGQASSMLPSTKNAELYRQVEALKSISSAEALNSMRQQSKTGGALGNVTEKELKLLAEQGGALAPASPNFERDLRDYAIALMRTIHGYEAGNDIFANSLAGTFTPREGDEGSQVAPQDLPPVPNGISPQEWPALYESMSPEDKVLFQ